MLAEGVSERSCFSKAAILSSSEKHEIFVIEQSDFRALPRLDEDRTSSVEILVNTIPGNEDGFAMHS